MTHHFPKFLLLLLLAIPNAVTGNAELEAVQRARHGMLEAINWAQGLTRNVQHVLDYGSSNNSVAVGDCLNIYEDSEALLALLELSSENYSFDDAITWLSGALTSHRSCLDGLEEKGLSHETQPAAQDLTLLLHEALSSVKQQGHFGRAGSYGVPRSPANDEFWGLLASWDAATSKADLVVAQDGSGNHGSIIDAVAALSKMSSNRPERTIIYIKSGVYHEKVEIRRALKNVMFVGDGMDKTIVTGYHSVVDGASTWGSATFGNLEH